MALASLSWWDASDTWLPAWPSVALVMGANLASTPPRAAAMKPFSARGSPPRHVSSRGAIVDGRTGAGGGAGAGALGGGGGRKGGEGEEPRRVRHERPDEGRRVGKEPGEDSRADCLCCPSTARRPVREDAIASVTKGVPG